MFVHGRTRLSFVLNERDWARVGEAVSDFVDCSSSYFPQRPKLRHVNKSVIVILSSQLNCRLDDEYQRKFYWEIHGKAAIKNNSSITQSDGLHSNTKTIFWDSTIQLPSDAASQYEWLDDSQK